MARPNLAISLSRRDYGPLSQTDNSAIAKMKALQDDESATTYSCAGCQQQACQRRSGSSTTARILGGALLLASVFFLGCATTITVYFRHGIDAAVYDTDFPPARQAIEMEERQFTGAPWWDSEGLPYFSEEDKKIPYLGTSPVSIPAWEELIKDRYFLLTEEEARQAWGPDYKKYYRYPDIPGHPGGYVGGLDVLHSLHCVNELRKQLFSKNRCDYNQTEYSRAVEEYHIVHCLEMMRQNIECKSDLSMVPAIWWPGLNNGNGSSFIFTEQKHTCRNFKKIRQWASERYARTKRMGESNQLPPDDV